MAKRESIQYTMLKRALDGIQNENTTKAYKHDIKAFALWARDEGYKSVADIEAVGASSVVQRYRDEAVLSRTSSPHTEHRAICAVCKGLGITRPQHKGDAGWEDRIITSRRSAGRITRGRSADGNRRGLHEEAAEKYRRLVDFQSCVGIRRHELMRLRGRDLVKDESGRLCVLIEKGKGGKVQLQRIFDEDIDAVRSVFAGIGPDQKVFSREEMSNHINLHRMRARQAQYAYTHYAAITDPQERRQLADQLLARHKAMHPDGHGWAAFKREVEKCFTDPVYHIRGENKERALTLDLPTEYDRLALMAVSVFHLSHWRINVTVTNYMIH